MEKDVNNIEVLNYEVLKITKMENKKMLPHQQKLIDEFNELEIKIKSLQFFIEIDENLLFSNCIKQEQSDLNEQLSIMNRYSAVLKRRINRF